MQSEQNSEPAYHINSLHLDAFLKRIAGDDEINSVSIMHALDNDGELTLDHIHLTNIQENHLIFNEHGLKYDNELKSYTLLPKKIADTYISKAFKINHYLIEDASTGNVYQLSALNEQSKNRYRDTGSYALHVATWGKGNQNKAEIQGLLETCGWNIDEDNYHSTPEMKFFKSYHEKKEFKPSPLSPNIPVRKVVVKKDEPTEHPFENKLSADGIEPHSLAVTFISNQLSFLDQAQKMDSSKQNQLPYRTYYDFVTRALLGGKKDLSFKVDKDELADISKIISILINKGAITKYRDAYKITGRIPHSALAIKKYTDHLSTAIINKLAQLQIDSHPERSPPAAVVAPVTPESEVTNPLPVISAGNNVGPFTLGSPETPRPHYLIRDDLAWATQSWRGTCNPDCLDRANHWFIDNLCRIMHDAFANSRLAHGWPRDPVMTVVFADMQERLLQNIVKDHLVINLDVVTADYGHAVGVSRKFGLADAQFYSIEVIERPGYEGTFAVMAMLDTEQPYALVDDDITTGMTMAAVEQRLPPGIRIADRISLSERAFRQQYGNQDYTVWDIVDARDFLIGARDSGLVVGLPDNRIARAPYMLPYVSLTNRAKLPPDQELETSRRILQLNETYHAMLDNKISLEEADPYFQELMTGLGIADHTMTLRQVVTWHSRQHCQTVSSC